MYLNVKTKITKKYSYRIFIVFCLLNLKYTYILENLFFFFFNYCGEIVAEFVAVGGWFPSQGQSKIPPNIMEFGWKLERERENKK